MSISIQGQVPSPISFPPPPIHNHTVVYPLNFGSTNIQWPNNVLPYIPNELNQTLDAAISYLNTNSTYFSYFFTYSFTIGGHQGSPGGTAVTDSVFCNYNCSSVYYSGNDGKVTDSHQFRIETDNNDNYTNTPIIFDQDYSYLTTFTDLNGVTTDFTKIYPTYIALYPHTYCSGSHCTSDEPINYSVTITLLLNVTLNCSTDLSNTICQNFIQTNILQNGPNVNMDSLLNPYCQGKYSGMEALLQTDANNPDRNVCACHLQQEQYENYKATLVANFSGAGFALNTINERCLWGPCASSSFPSVETGNDGKCNVPLCLNVVAVNGDGTFSVDKGNIEIEQSSNCGSVTPGGSGTPISTTKKMIIIIGIILFVIVIIIGIYIYLSKE